MLEIYQGETVKFEITIKNPDGTNASLTGATAVLAYGGNGITTVQKTCTITGNLVTATITPAETKVLPAGRYKYELKIKDSDGLIDTVASEPIKVNESLIPNYN